VTDKQWWCCEADFGSHTPDCKNYVAPQPDALPKEVNMRERDNYLRDKPESGEHRADSQSTSAEPKDALRERLFDAKDVERLANKHNTSDKWNINFPAFTAELNELVRSLIAEQRAKVVREALDVCNATGHTDGILLRAIAALKAQVSK
jgi:hypothetical protein